MDRFAIVRPPFKEIYSFPPNGADKPDEDQQHGDNQPDVPFWFQRHMREQFEQTVEVLRNEKHQTANDQRAKGLGQGNGRLWHVRLHSNRASRSVLKSLLLVSSLAGAVVVASAEMDGGTRLSMVLGRCCN